MHAANHDCQSNLQTTHIVPSALHLLILELTDGCNLACQICSYWQVSKPQTLSPDDVRKLIRDLGANFPPFVLLTGGEPLMHKSIQELVSIIAETTASIALCTNGLLLTRNRHWIVKYLHELFISIWGARPETHDRLRGSNMLANLVVELQSFLSLSPRPEVVLRYTVMPQNIAELTAFAKLAIQLGVDGISIQPADRNRDNFGPNPLPSAWETATIDPGAAKHCFEEFFRAATAAGILRQTQASFDRVRDYALAALCSNSIAPPSCNAPWRSMVVNSRLEVSPCYFLDAVGDLRSQSISDLISGPLTDLRTRLDVAANPTCAQCVCPRIYPGR